VITVTSGSLLNEKPYLRLLTSWWALYVSKRGYGIGEGTDERIADIWQSMTH